MDESTLLIRVEPEGVGFLTLNRPRQVNAVTLDMWRRLPELLADLAQRPEVRVVVLHGAGGNFSAGADIREFTAHRTGSAAGLAYEHTFEAAVRAVRDVPKPTIAAVMGNCMGGACALAMACDFRIAHAGARFAIPAARLGVVYALQECQLLLALVGVATAKRILFTGDALEAAEALRVGLVDQLVDRPAEEAALEWAARMAGNAPLSIAGCKRILNSIATGDAQARLEELQALTVQAMNSADYREGTQAFVEKRKPRFTGR